MSECDHMTSIMEMQIGRVTISRCEWDCRDILISILRDDGVTVTYTSAELSALRARAAEVDRLAEQLEQAREIILAHRSYTIDGWHMKQRDAWLAANAPAPAEERTA